jgi:hypothetical protein
LLGWVVIDSLFLLQAVIKKTRPKIVKVILIIY